MTTITKEEVKAFIEQIESDLSNGWEAQIFELKLARIALASLTAEPVLYAAEETLAYANMGEIHLTCLSEPMGDAVIPLYTAPPAPVVPEEIEPDSNNTYDYVDGWNACRAAMLQGAEPVSQTYELPELIEGMEVSVDVSTCDFDAGHRYFGTVTEVSELDTAKNGYILLVQDAKPNFDVNGNSPVTPDGWVIVPKKLTAENGAKGVLSGEFSETTFISCPECFGDDDCDTCDGSGRIEIKVPVTWTTIKSIWDKGIAHFAAKPPQEVNRG